MKEEKSVKLKRKRSQRRNKVLRTPRRIIGVFFGVLTLGFLTWLFISVISVDTTLTVNTIYELPEFESLDTLPNLDYGDYTVVIDNDIAHKMSDEKKVLPTASTAKMILGLMVMEQKPFNAGENGETITITQEMYERYLWYVAHDGSNTRVSVGENISEYDALMAVFLASSNNMADSLAIWAFGSMEQYHDFASAKLIEWGIADTFIGVDASGFDASTTSTTTDLAMIGQRILSNPVLSTIVGTAEYEIPVAGKIENTNKILGQNRISGIKTGFIGDVSGYCLVSGYLEGGHIITTALLGAPTRLQSFDDSLAVTTAMQDLIKEQTIITTGQTVGYYDSWWTGPVAITANDDLKVIGWKKANKQVDLVMDGEDGSLKVRVGKYDYNVAVTAEKYEMAPTLGERLAHSFGWNHDGMLNTETKENEEDESVVEEDVQPVEETEKNTDTNSTSANSQLDNSGNCTLGFGNLMLINPNFPVEVSYIDARKSQLVSVSSRYGIVEGNAYNGDNLLTAEAAEHLNQMVKAYESDYPGHTFETRSCYRARGTTCGRLCAATGTSDHHTGLTCDLLDPAYGTELDTDTYNQHIDWQWLYANSYKYGFIDRFPAEWAGGSMSEPLNVDANGTTGLFETWHYRYVGVVPATEIATGKYNNGEYDSLEHYLKARGMVSDLKNGKCS